MASNAADKGIKGMLGIFVKGPFGMGVALGWYYCLFYSCVLVWPEWTIRESEHYWALALGVTALVSAALFGLLRKGRSLNYAHPVVLSAVMLACACSPLCIFAGYSGGLGLGAVYVGAALAGAALPVVFLQWLSVLKRYGRGVIEFSVPAAFLVSLALYLPIVSTKNIVSIALVAMLPVVFTLLFAAQAGKTAQEEKEGVPAFGPRTASAIFEQPLSPAQLDAKGLGGDFARNARELWKTGALFLVLWFSFAFFRSCVSPTYFTDRFDHYLLPFACAGALAALFCGIVILHARRVSLFTTYRWVIPFMCLGYAMLIVDDGGLSKFAFTASFVGLVGLQLCFAMVTVKQARQDQIPLGYLVLPLLFFIGVGVAAGSACGLAVLDLVMSGVTLNYAPLMIVLLVTAVMAWGVDIVPLIKQPERSVAKEDGATNILSLNVLASKIIDSAAVSQARVLGEIFGLSPREQEILGYLLSGRSRPFIRDELVLSLNTVNTHVRNIYAKVNVHSQQELLTLAREIAGNAESEEVLEVTLRKSG